MRQSPLARVFSARVLVVLALLVGFGAGAAVERHRLDLVPLAGRDPAKAPDFRLMHEAWRLIDQNFVDRSAIKSKPMTYDAIAGMVDALGDTGHSAFLSPRMVKEGKEALEGHFPGIGAEVSMQDNQVVIVAPIDGTPAQRAGLRPGEIIFKVNGKLVAGQSLEQVVRKIRGPAGSQVSLSIREPHTDKTRIVVLTRAVIHVHSVTWKMLPGTRVADVRIASFSRDTGKELKRAVAALKQQGAQAVILDLRDDPGGLLEQAISVASQFLTKGDVLLEKDVQGRVTPVPVSDDEPKLALPMAVLVNAGTASASEIVSGALQDAGRATVVGEKTFGTGTVLQEFPLSDGSALMLAVEEWLTPKGHTIWHKGITPDVKVTLARDVHLLYPATLREMDAAKLRASKDAQLLKALSLLEKSIKAAGAH